MMKVSIITTTYNSSRTIRDTIESVISQKYDNIEYLLIDGFSDDNTIDIVRSYDELSSRNLKIISESDSGIYDAMNKGIKLATGDIIGFLNSDDFFKDAYVVNKIVETFDANIDAVYGDVLYVDKDNIFNVKRFYSSSLFKRWTMRIGFMPAHPTFYVRKNIVKEIGGFNKEYKIAADFELLFRYIYVNRIKTKYIREVMVIMRDGGISNRSWTNRLKINSEHISAIRSYGYYSSQFTELMRYSIKFIELLFGKVFSIYCYIFNRFENK